MPINKDTFTKLKFSLSDGGRTINAKVVYENENVKAGQSVVNGGTFTFDVIGEGTVRFRNFSLTPALRDTVAIDTLPKLFAVILNNAFSEATKSVYAIVRIPKDDMILRRGLGAALVKHGYDNRLPAPTAQDLLYNATIKINQ